MSIADNTSALRRTLHDLADADDRTERRRLSGLLASQLEVELNTQLNRTQVALWDVQESAFRKIDDLHEHQSDTNLLLAKVVEGLQGMRDDMQHAAEEHAARLGKLEVQVDDLDVRQSEQWRQAMDLLDASKRDRADLRGRINLIIKDQFTPEQQSAIIAEQVTQRAALAELRRRLDSLEQQRHINDTM